MDSFDQDFDFKIDLTDNTQITKINRIDEDRPNITSSTQSTSKEKDSLNIDITSNNKNITTKDDAIPKSPDKDEIEQLKNETLTSIVEKAIINSCLKEYLQLKAEEMVSSSSCIKKLKVEGRVGRESEKELDKLQKNIYDRLTVKLGRNFRKEEFWYVDCGMKIGEKFEKFEAYDANYNPVDITHEPGTLLVIDFWSYWSDINSYLNHRMQTMIKIEEGKVEGISLDKIKSVSLSGEENEKIWKSVANNEKLNKYIPQYQSQLVYHQVGIEKIPSIMIVNKEGLVSYIGTYKEINFEKSIQNLLLDKSIVLSSEEEINYENNSNSWWLEMDNESKIDIVRDINMTLRQMGCTFSSFIVVTNSLHYLSTVKNVTYPMFVGTMSETQYEIAQSFAIELQNAWNFNDFKFNVKVLNYY